MITLLFVTCYFIFTKLMLCFSFNHCLFIDQILNKMSWQTSALKFKAMSWNNDTWRTRELRPRLLVLCIWGEKNVNKTVKKAVSRHQQKCWTFPLNALLFWTLFLFVSVTYSPCFYFLPCYRVPFHCVWWGGRCPRPGAWVVIISAEIFL